jgi:hypothetical protein
MDGWMDVTGRLIPGVTNRRKDNNFLPYAHNDNQGALSGVFDRHSDCICFGNAALAQIYEVTPNYSQLAARRMIHKLQVFEFGW